MLIRIIVLFILITGSQNLLGQDCTVSRINFKSGESITYRAVYNWGFLWVNAGDVLFSVTDTVYMGKPAFHFTSLGWSLRRYDRFFKVRDRFESIVNPKSLLPYWFERDTYEGGFEVYNRYVFRRTDSLVDIISQTSERPFRRERLNINPCSFDVLSAIYYCRTIDFDKYQIEDKIPLTMVIDNEVFDLFIRYQGKERFKARDGKEYDTIKFTIMLVEGTIFKGGEDMIVWVTDDKNRIPVMVEAKILIGSIKAVLTGYEGILHPMEALIQ